MGTSSTGNKNDRKWQFSKVTICDLETFHWPASKIPTLRIHGTRRCHAKFGSPLQPGCPDEYRHYAGIRRNEKGPIGPTRAENPTTTTKGTNREHDTQLNAIYDAFENLLDEKATQRKWDERPRIGFKTVRH
jgi:hypothetical protein